ncbi:acetone carboxylase subunit gamma [Pseudoclavibacter sp. 13-3]|uniref:acetone carboxylase subunit gamma n=1 Tax=Pseudoclavibacter sp. 13-3 TaxID=2901228 RepID=UPI001E44D599|nr:acetone carboxylase subunit gamma [Pseudoclavibacter sp. 13-3]MCD7100767.1 acetone carboxylase subunit gamma [Pseudoclavibacter sp. 13-3]
MRVPMTEYLRINLDTELWECRVCEQSLGDARGNYKEGTLVYDRDPREIHQSIIDPERYEFTFAPDPTYCRILEYYCPSCGVQLETEYLPPGHPPTVDMLWDIDSLREQWQARGVDPEQVITYGPDDGSEPEGARHSHASQGGAA